MPLLGRINYHLFRIIKSRKFVGISYQLYYAVFEFQDFKCTKAFSLFQKIIPHILFYHAS